jgi:hypothetical protein
MYVNFMPWSATPMLRQKPVMIIDTDESDLTSCTSEEDTGMETESEDNLAYDVVAILDCRTRVSGPGDDL